MNNKFEMIKKIQNKMSSFYDHKVSKELNRYLLSDQNTWWKLFVRIYRRNRIIKKYGITLGLHMRCEGPVMFPHPRNIVIGDLVEIGSNCIIYHDVTIGKKNFYDNPDFSAKNPYPLIKEDVIIYPGAKIVGSITLGKQSVIGANAVVIRDVGDGETVGGNPAQMVNGGKNK